MKQYISQIVLLLMVNNAVGQIQTDLSNIYFEELFKTSTVIKSIKPSETNFDDLEEIGKSIGDKRIVLLGEPNHGDGGAIQMKTRLVKYLHERKGFDVLLFEADLFSIMFGMTNLIDTTLIKLKASENIYTCWTESNVSQELWTYLNNQSLTKHPISLGGIDCRHSGDYAKNNLVSELTKILNENSYNTGSESYKLFSRDINYILKNEFSAKKDSVDEETFNSEMKNIKEFIEYKFQGKTRMLWLIEINNIAGCFDFLINGSNRDLIMAKNFNLLKKYIYPNRKIIVWSHNNHNVLDVNTWASANPEWAKWWYENDTYKAFTYFGAEILKQFNNEIYSLAITSGSGNYSPGFFGKDYFHADFSKTDIVPKSNQQSLEYFLKSKKSKVVFIPLPIGQGKPSGFPWFYSRLFDLTFEAKLDYTSAFHGIIYIEKTNDLNGQ